LFYSLLNLQPNNLQPKSLQPKSLRMKKVLILINKISEKPTEDELDVLSQASEVEEALKELGYQSSRVFMNLNLEETRQNILSYSPDLVFNLVETIDQKGDLIYLAPKYAYSVYRLHSRWHVSHFQ
jgi:hypothetical protein